MDQDIDYHPLLALSISAKPTAAALKISRFDDHWGYYNTTKSNFCFIEDLVARCYQKLFQKLLFL